MSMEVDEDVMEVRDVAQGHADRNLPWVEKYRPGQLEHIVSHKEIIETRTNELFWFYYRKPLSQPNQN